MVSDLASLKSDSQVIPVEQPRIYFGEVIAQANPDYAIVGAAGDSGPREYDTDTDKYTYDGSGGVSIGNWFNRLAFAAKYAERNILFSARSARIRRSCSTATPATASPRSRRG